MQEQHAGDPDLVSSPANQTECTPLGQLICETTKNLDESLHGFEATCDVCEEIGCFHAGAGVVDARSVDDHDALPVNLGLKNANLAGARVDSLSNLLFLGRDEVDELDHKAKASQP